MYMFYTGKKSARWRIEPRTSRRDSSHLNPFVSSADANQNKVEVSIYNSTWRLVTYVWPGPAAPPAPAITSPTRASTWISLKPRSAAKQGLERWRNSPRLERWPVAVQWTQTKRSTGAGGAGVIPYMGPMMGELNRPAGVQKN